MSIEQAALTLPFAVTREHPWPPGCVHFTVGSYCNFRIIALVKQVAALRVQLAPPPPPVSLVCLPQFLSHAPLAIGFGDIPVTPSADLLRKISDLETEIEELKLETIRWLQDGDLNREAVTDI
jgi:hypothetical protein